MARVHDLDRFVQAQQDVFSVALAELYAGSKQTHWMWFIFPQLAGLGRSPTAQYYAISSPDEASAYLTDPLLGARLRQCVEALLPWAGRRTAEEILGPVDALKLRSSLTLFDRVEPKSVFDRALTGLYGGERDQLTLALLNSEE